MIGILGGVDDAVVDAVVDAVGCVRGFFLTMADEQSKEALVPCSGLVVSQQTDMALPNVVAQGHDILGTDGCVFRLLNAEGKLVEEDRLFEQGGDHHGRR